MVCVTEDAGRDNDNNNNNNSTIIMSTKTCRKFQHQPASSLVFCLFFTGFLFAIASTSNTTLVCPEGKSACLDESGCYAEDDVCDRIPYCYDGSDEMNCTRSCQDDEFFCAAENECLPPEYKCDGEEDCSDGTDEEHCTNVTCGFATEFMCVSDRTCIVGSLKCDGVLHCHDNSDEENCGSSTAEPSGCDTETRFDCLQDGTHCIPLDMVCDGHEDCRNGEDESDPSCEINSTSHHCSVNNGGCSHECVENDHGHHCECPEGLQLGYNRLTCDDVDECVNHACSHRCKNLHGHYECSCLTGYRLIEDYHGCIADGEEPELWVTNGSYLVRHKLRSRVEQIMHLGGLLHGFTYAYHSGKIFWIDSVKRVIYWSNNDTDRSSEILIDTMKDVPVALAYDWVHNNLYWADAGRHAKIEIVTLERKWRTVVLSTPEVDHPKALVVDPRDDQGYLYWAQGGHNPVIRRAGLDGSEPQTIVSTDVESVHSMSLDLVDSRLFWVDSRLNILQSFGLVNYDRDILTTFVEYPKIPIGIGVFEDYVYWSDAESKSVYTMYKFRREGEETPQITTLLENLTTPNTVEIYHKMKQSYGSSYCGTNNGGCSHICLPSPRYEQFRCVCPMSTVKTQSFVPDPNNSSLCLLLDSSLSSTAVKPKISVSSTTALPPVDVASSASTPHTPTNFIFKALLLSAWTTSNALSLAKENVKVNSNISIMWLYVGVGVSVGIMTILLLSLVNTGFNTNCIFNMWEKSAL